MAGRWLGILTALVAGAWVSGLAVASSNVFVRQLSLQTQSVDLLCDSTPGVVLRLEHRADLTGTNAWDPVFSLCATGGPVSVNQVLTDDVVPAIGFYRVTAGTNRVAAGERGVTYVADTNGALYAVQIHTPRQPRYPLPSPTAGVLVFVPGFMTDSHPFMEDIVSRAGLIQISLLWPGLNDPCGASSQGTYDYGGPDCMAMLGLVLRYAAGMIPDAFGRRLDELIAVTPDPGNLGVAAISHAGVAAVNGLYFHAAAVTNLQYYVGWENPTFDQTLAFDVGDWTQPRTDNPYYSFPADYSSMNLLINYARVRWHSTAPGIAYFDGNGNDHLDFGLDYQLPPGGCQMFGKRYYSRALLHALEDNGQLSTNEPPTGTAWPSDLARPDEADRDWSYRASPARYPALAAISNLHVMLLFARRDHAQPAADKPHLHQAYDGFRHAAGLWTRLNPDRSYLEWARGGSQSGDPDTAANTEPTNAVPPEWAWANIQSWAYDGNRTTHQLALCAAAAEMADRVHTTNWDVDLTNTLVSYPTP